MMPLPSLDWLREKELVLVTVSILQPVEWQALIDHLHSRISTEQLSDLVDELLEEGRIVSEQNRYRTTMRGERSVVPRKGAALRDIQRLLHLVQSGTRGRG